MQSAANLIACLKQSAANRITCLKQSAVNKGRIAAKSLAIRPYFYIY